MLAADLGAAGHDGRTFHTLTHMTLLDRFRLDGKVAIVTGASSGLGVAFADGLAEAGAEERGGRALAVVGSDPHDWTVTHLRAGNALLQRISSVLGPFAA